MRPDSGNEYGDAIVPRLEALDRALGPHADYLVSPIPFFLGGRATIASFPDAIPNAVVYCTSEMTGWDSGQQHGDGDPFEFAIAVPNESLLRPSDEGNSLARQGWIGSLLSGMASFSTEALILHAETAGPLDPALAPMTRLLFTEFTQMKSPFSYKGRSYGIRLMTLITESEFEFAVKTESVPLLIDKLRARNPYLISDLHRTPIA
jgi:hypothetical protein